MCRSCNYFIMINDEELLSFNKDISLFCVYRVTYVTGGQHKFDLSIVLVASYRYILIYQNLYVFQFIAST